MRPANTGMPNQLPCAKPPWIFSQKVDPPCDPFLYVSRKIAQSASGCVRQDD